MRQYIFEKSYPSLDYIVLRWPKCRHAIAKYALSNYIKPDLLKVSKACLKSLNFYKKDPLLLVIKDLTKKCSRNFTSNKYHDQHHFKAVLVISCLFAKLYKLKNKDKILLVIIALTHDMSHQGKRIISHQFYQEKKTINELRCMVYKKLLNRITWIRIKRIILNTYFPINPMVSNDIVEKIILDSDIASSTLFGFRNGLKLSKRLKNEIGFNEKSIILYKNFLNLIKSRKFYF